MKGCAALREATCMAQGPVTGASPLAAVFESGSELPLFLFGTQSQD